MTQQAHDTLTDMNEQLTPEEREALDELLPPQAQSGDLAADLVAAARTAMRRRIDNSRWGGAVIGALHRELHSWRRLEQVTGIPQATARRWASPPPETDNT